MSIILSIETSEKVCSIAISDGYNLIGTLEIADEKSHSAMLTVIIQQLLKEKDIEINTLNAIAVSKGPGSYTGLRIGVSVAKGICYALNIPLIGINTLQIMCVGFLNTEQYRRISAPDKNFILCPMMDARRMEVYSAIFNTLAEPIGTIEAKIIDPYSYANELLNNRMLFFGSGANKCKDVIQNQNAFFFENFKPRATDMVGLAYDAFVKQNFEDVAYFEPFYLKDFVATVPKRKTFNF